jgi:hypothetical protein
MKPASAASIFGKASAAVPVATTRLSRQQMALHITNLAGEHNIRVTYQRSISRCRLRAFSCGCLCQPSFVPFSPLRVLQEFSTACLAGQSNSRNYR